MEKNIISIQCRKSIKSGKNYICAVYEPTGKIICFGDRDIHDIFGVKWTVLEDIIDEIEDYVANFKKYFIA